MPPKKSFVGGERNVILDGSVNGDEPGLTSCSRFHFSPLASRSILIFSRRAVVNLKSSCNCLLNLRLLQHSQLHVIAKGWRIESFEGVRTGDSEGSFGDDDDDDRDSGDDGDDGDDDDDDDNDEDGLNGIAKGSLSSSSSMKAKKPSVLEMEAEMGVEMGVEERRGRGIFLGRASSITLVTGEESRFSSSSFRFETLFPMPSRE